MNLPPPIKKTKGEITIPKLPGDPLAKRELHFIWIVDCSDSTDGAIIQSLNFAIKNSLPALKDAAAGNPYAEVLVRAVKFSSGASWHVATPNPVEQFNWNNLQAGGTADMGRALQLVAEQLDPAVMPKRALPPVLVLISCTRPTDDVDAGLRAMMGQPWGQKAVRIAVAVGDDTDNSVLQRFIGRPEQAPLQACNADNLVNYIRWASTEISKSGPSRSCQAVKANRAESVPPRKRPSTSETASFLVESDCPSISTLKGENSMAQLPGGPISQRPLHFIWIADCSGSMGGAKIQSLNYAIKNALPAMKKAAAENPYAEVMVRAVKFSTGASWHFDAPQNVEQFSWKDLQAGGVTDMGKALKLVAEKLDESVMPDRALPPVLVLISDGQPTDDINVGLGALKKQRWAQKAVRIAIAIGDDANKDVLRRFIDHPELEPLQANSAEGLVNYIEWVSTAVLISASSPASQQFDKDSEKGTNVPFPRPPDPDDFDPSKPW